MINKVNSINGNRNVQNSEFSFSDIKSKNIESQLTSKQQRLNKISGDSKMSEQEKIKERQKIRQQIAELNRKLKMEQIKEEENQKKIEKEKNSKIVYEEEVKREEILKEKDKDKKETEIEEEKKIEFEDVSYEEMFKILNMNLKIQQERVIDNVERKKTGMENVLSSEIKMDSLHGVNNNVKKEQLSEMMREKLIQIRELGFEEETNILGINNNRKIVIKDY